MPKRGGDLALGDKWRRERSRKRSKWFEVVEVGKEQKRQGSQIEPGSRGSVWGRQTAPNP